MSIPSVYIFWDFGTCPAPLECSGFAITRKIRALALRIGHVKSFKAYLNIAEHNTPLLGFSSTNTAVGGSSGGSRALAQRSELQSSGVSLVDVPGRSEDVYKILIVDVLAHAFDRTTSSDSILLISSDSGLAYTLSILQMRGHRVALLSTGLEDENERLAAQASISFDWNAEIINTLLEPHPPPAQGGKGLPSSKEVSSNSSEVSLPARVLDLTQHTPTTSSLATQAAKLLFEPDIDEKERLTSPPMAVKPIPPVSLSPTQKRRIELGNIDPPQPKPYPVPTTSQSTHNYISQSQPLPTEPTSASGAGILLKNKQGEGITLSPLASTFKPSVAPKPTHNPRIEANLTPSGARIAFNDQQGEVPLTDWASPFESSIAAPQSTDLLSLHFGTFEAQTSPSMVPSTPWKNQTPQHSTSNPAIPPGPSKRFSDVPIQFKPLIYVLRTLENETGDAKPLWGTVAPYIKKQHPWVYQYTGTSKFSGYVRLAEESGVVRNGGGMGATGTQWVMSLVME